MQNREGGPPWHDEKMPKNTHLLPQRVLFFCTVRRSDCQDKELLSFLAAERARQAASAEARARRGAVEEPIRHPGPAWRSRPSLLVVVKSNS